MADISSNSEETENGGSISEVGQSHTNHRNLLIRYVLGVGGKREHSSGKVVEGDKRVEEALETEQVLQRPHLWPRCLPLRLRH